MNLFDFVGHQGRERLQVVLQAIDIRNRKLFSALRGNQLRDHIARLLSAIRRFRLLPLPHRLKHGVAVRFHKFAGEIVGLTIVQRHRAIDLVLEGARNLADQFFRLLQSRAGAPLPTPLGVIPHHHAPARLQAVRGNLVTFDSDDAKRLFHEPTLSQTVTRLKFKTIFY